MIFIASFQLAVSLQAAVCLGPHAVTHESKTAARRHDIGIRFDRGRG